MKSAYSIATASLETAVINIKNVNSNPLDHISRDFQAIGLDLSNQSMSAERYGLMSDILFRYMT